MSEEIQNNESVLTVCSEIRSRLDEAAEQYDFGIIDPDEMSGWADRAETAYRREMDEAAGFINDFLYAMPINRNRKEAHNWLIRNGYKDTSSLGDFYGQEVVP